MAVFSEAQRAALQAWLLAVADDELVLAHRNSEWTGHAPILEEDIAFANIAQDELGHATLWYGALEALGVDGADRLVFFRPAADFRNAQVVELPKGDWAFTMLRQYLFDVFEAARCERLIDSDYQPLADIAAKIRREEIYHRRHTSAWVRRLGLGTDESQRRLQAALEQLWPYQAQLFRPISNENVLVEAGIVPAAAALQASWTEIVTAELTEAGLTLPSETRAGGAPPRSAHSEHLEVLLADLQLVARSDPEAAW
ncbi:MAG: 1,2-phenylacetyl-CoA epoxidase subunit PaaC [Candidatus Promineifilaceae bacterium]|nr:1,2-phenylacetyl-CoA epoxidase subunit PaaC [Candidatus Promineifilaceae bacterium]